MRYSMENASMKVEVESLGAELKSVLGKKSNIEYMWCSNPEYYKRSAPNLFPIVGSLKDGVYHYQGKTYKMGQHGYVRDVEWKVEKKDENTLVFTHQSDDTTKEKYPFDYAMELIYHMNGNRLEITWNIKNTGKEKMYFSCGFHPCFSCPVHGEADKGGYGYDMHMNGNVICRDFDVESGLALNSESELKLENGFAAFTKDFFDNGAYVIENNQTHEVSLRDPEGKNYLNVYFPEAPLFGLWSAEKKNVPYAAVEPWFGRCDKEDFNGSLEEREWGHVLAQGACFQAAYTIEIAGED